MNDSAILTAEQAGALLGLSARKMYELAAEGALAHMRPSKGAVRFLESDVLEYRAQCRSTATKRMVVGALNLTAASLDAGASGLESAFRKLGVDTKRMHSTEPKPPASTPSRRERSALKLVSSER